MLETAKHSVGKATDLGRRPREGLPCLVRARKPLLFRFTDDGETPNNPRWPLVLFRSPVLLHQASDPAAVFEVIFGANGWRECWRDGIYDYLHFHTRTHEVLGIARGSARVQFGGAAGRALHLKAGDVVVLPAGTGHQRLSASHDLVVVGAYPARSGNYDEPRPSAVEHMQAVKRIEKVKAPPTDPVFGKNGPLLELWQ
ncbi:MAG: cupin domain-containing protein [Rhizomicrobium sp.]